MNANLKISGEAGKKLGLARVTTASLGIERPRVRLANMSDDKLTFSQPFQSPQDAGVDQFDLGQKVELWNDEKRVFSGHFLYSEPDDSGDNFTVNRMVIGPWWWMRQTPLTGVVDEEAGTERATLVFPNGDLAGHLLTLLKRAIALGVPIQIGEIAECYDIPQVTLKKKSVADGLSELMSRLPDGVVEIDHSGTGFPTVNIRRRDTMEAVTFKRGVYPLSDVRIRPRIDQQATQVQVTYLSRDEDGKRVISEQIAGASSGALPSRQIVAVSGDELGQLVPDSDDSQEVETSGVASDSTLLAIALARSSEFQTAKENGLTSSSGMIIKYRFPATKNYQTVFSSDLPATNQSHNIEPVSYTLANGITGTVIGKYFYLGGDPPEWLQELLGMYKVTISGPWAYEWKKSHGNSGGTTATYDIPDWMFYLTSDLIETGFRGVPNSYDTYSLYIGQWSAEVWMVGEEYDPVATLYKPPGFDFVLPPADFASNLQKAQSWLPYEGSVTLTEDAVGSVPYLGRVLNIHEHLAEYRNMRALPQSLDLDFDQGITTINLGSPPRQSLSGIIDRVKQSEDDNIVYA